MLPFHTENWFAVPWLCPLTCLTAATARCHYQRGRPPVDPYIHHPPDGQSWEGGKARKQKGKTWVAEPHLSFLCGARHRASLLLAATRGPTVTSRLQDPVSSPPQPTSSRLPIRCAHHIPPTRPHSRMVVTGYRSWKSGSGYHHHNPPGRTYTASKGEEKVAERKLKETESAISVGHDTVSVTRRHFGPRPARV